MFRGKALRCKLGICKSDKAGTIDPHLPFGGKDAAAQGNDAFLFAQRWAQMFKTRSGTKERTSPAEFVRQRR